MGRTRRTVIGSLAGALTLAGCLKRSPIGGSHRFEDISVNGTNLVIELTESEAVDGVTVIDPSGAKFADHDFDPGETRATIEIGTEYEPGEYDVNAIVDDEIVEVSTVRIEPELAITDVGIGANHPERMPDNLTSAENQLFLEVENSGTGLEAVLHLELTGDVPNPAPREEHRHSGIFNEDDGYGEYRQVVIGAGETVPLFTSRFPFISPSQSCEYDSVEVSLVTQIQETLETTYEIQSQPGSESCGFTIRGE